LIAPKPAKRVRAVTISKLGNTIYVTYALQNGKNDLTGPGHGIVIAFDQNGNLLGRIATMGSLNSPWGLAIAPSGFGSRAGDLLVGNFGDGRSNVFSPDRGSPEYLSFLAQRQDLVTSARRPRASAAPCRRTKT
jgi:uncharacterized protein (TIGR03118 family)